MADYEIPVFRYIDKVERFIEENPRSNVRQIREALGLNKSTAATCLSNLRKAGRVRQVPKTKTERRIRWECGADHGEVEPVSAGFKQATVKTWEPCTVRDPLVGLLFGRAGPTS